ncbi:hypothetical protein [Brevibacterium sp. ZH18]|uniref:hypothetical protein n=1 Tax=Brevibacterium sp. ZH18 TaxID=2927784 RepID=UPI001F6175F5|nr:hypothetical protein [Brevibacterium sp. ZH18]MCI4009978.1 hypothetical protein [Brevibacterium sp. ZH18]
MSNTATKRVRNSASFADVIIFIISFAMFVFGIYLFGTAMGTPEGTEFWVFWGGLLSAGLSFLVPMIYHWLRDHRE